jgi:hypothetical protein
MRTCKADGCEAVTLTPQEVLTWVHDQHTAFVAGRISGDTDEAEEARELLRELQALPTALLRQAVMGLEAFFLANRWLAGDAYRLIAEILRG